MKAMDKMLPKTAEDMKEFYETEFKKLIELEEAKHNNKIMWWEEQGINAVTVTLNLNYTSMTTKKSPKEMSAAQTVE